MSEAEPKVFSEAGQEWVVEWSTKQMEHKEQTLAVLATSVKLIAQVVEMDLNPAIAMWAIQMLVTNTARTSLMQHLRQEIEMGVLMHKMPPDVKETLKKAGKL